MKKKNYLLAIFGIILTLLNFHNSFSQVNQEWVARYNGQSDSNDIAFSIAADTMGNTYVTGESHGDYVTIKYNSIGDSVWVATYNGPGNSFDHANSIALDNSGNVYVTGTSEGNSVDFATIKYNSAGVLQWTQRYNGTGYTHYAKSVVVDGSGNVYVSGTGSNGISDEYVTIKYDSAGDSVWVKKYNRPGFDIPSSIAVDNSGNVYVTGYSHGSGTSFDYATIKYNSSGDSVWVRRYNRNVNHSDYAYSIASDDSGNVYVTGESFDSTGGSDYATIKYNSSGDSVWVRLYSSPGNSSSDGASSIALDGSGNIYVTGKSSSAVSGYDYATVKYNSSGIQQWVAKYNGPGNEWDEANSIALDESNNVYVTGNSIDYDTLTGYDNDIATIKYSSEGVQEWVTRFDKARGWSIATDHLGNVYVTGSSYGSGTGWDYATIKYSQSTGITQISSEVPEEFSLSQNYPNPFNPNTIINYELRVTSYAKLVVYDILGKEVATLVNEKQNPGKYQVEFDGSGLTSGVYFYRLTAGEFTDTKRMMLVK